MKGDFVYDQLASGRKLRILINVDGQSHVCLATDPRFTCRGEDGVQALERVGEQIGYLNTMRVDTCSAFISGGFDLLAYANGVALEFCELGSLRTTDFSLHSTQSYAASF